MICTISSSLILIVIHLWFLHHTVPTLAAGSVSASNSTLILLSCGRSGTIKDGDNNRVWVGDVGSRYISQTTSEVLSMPYRDPLVPEIPFSAVRIFASDYTYTFPLSPGPYFLRLYFYPTNYSLHLASDSYFAVTAGSYTLLSNFSAMLTAKASNYEYLVREFSINVTSDTLDLTFSPSMYHLNSYAFINGIEIVSSPDLFSLSKAYLANGGSPTEFPIDSGMAFQTMYRLNVGGQSIGPSLDSGGLYRSWEDDSRYIFGAAFGVTYQNDPNVTIEYPSTVPLYIAPALVYETARSMGPNARINLNYNLTWILTVDAGFYYLLRFHFCEIQYPITTQNQRVFDIYINNQTAQTEFDVIIESGGIGIPVYKDYVVIITGGSGQMDMWIELHPDTLTNPMFYDAILNGLEVFKMSTAENSLAGLNPVPVSENATNPLQAYGKVHHHGSKGKVAALICGSVAGGVFLLSIIGFVCLYVIYRSRKNKERESGKVKVSDVTTLSVSVETTADSYNSFVSASVGTFHDAR